MCFTGKHLKRMMLAIFMLLMAWFSALADVVQADINTGLIAYYPFNGNANDASGNGHNGTVNGASLTTDRFNNQDSAYSFDGVDDYILIPNHSDFNMSGDYAFSVWIYQKSAVTDGSFRILDKATAATCNGWNLDTYDGSTGRRIRLDVSCPWTISNTPHSLNAWHHVVATVHGGYVTFYLDGNADGGGSVAATPTNSLDVYIGAAHPSGTSFNGFIDDVRIYNRALAYAEVQTLYAGDNFTLNFQGSGSGTVTGNGVRNGSAASFATNTGTTEQFDIGSILQLHGDPDDFNIFTGWSGDCSGNSDCSLTMTASSNVNAIFDFYADHRTRIGDTSSYYTSLQAAYDHSPNPGTVRAWATEYVENLNCNLAKNVTLAGGYNEGYTSKAGYTTLKGNLTIASGSLTCDRFIISACNGSCGYYSISGKITYNGTGLGGVSFRLTGPSASLITTDSDGNYSFTGLLNGTYTITPLLAGYTITPQQATIKSANITLNFSASLSVAPNAPTNLAATAVSASQINLSWSDNANNESGYKIERKTGAGGTYTQIAVTAANATTYADTGRSSNTTYYYRVRATNAIGNSGYSNETNTTTPAPYYEVYGAQAGDYYLTTTGHQLIGTSISGNTFNITGYSRFIIYVPASSPKILFDALGLGSGWVNSDADFEHCHFTINMNPTVGSWQESDSCIEGPPDGITMENVPGVAAYYGFTTNGASTLTVYIKQ